MGNSIYNQNSLLPIGTLLQMGKYRIDRYLSSGGFGNTYVITNLQFDEQFAMKEFFMKGINERNDDNTSISVSNKDNHTQFEQQREKFKKEARRLRKLENKHIVHVHDLFDENGTTYYIMDLIDGQSVSSIMKQTGSPLSETIALDIVRQILDALEIVHKERIWHLDLKPGNIMLDKQRNAIVIDFGASKQLSVNEGYTSTSTALCYTPGYAPSEQIDQNMERIGPWTDLYALGATLYNMVTLNQPPSVSEIIDGNAFRFPKSVCENTRKLIAWMMSPSRQKRPQSVKDVISLLNEEKEKDDILESSNEDTVYVLQQTIEKKNDCKEANWSNVEHGKIPRSDSKTIVKVLLGLFVLTLLTFVLSVLYGYNHQINPSVQKSNIPESSLIDSLRENNSLVQELLTQFVAYPNDIIENIEEYDSPIGICNYTGPYVDGHPNGLGIAIFNDGRIYIGNFYEFGKLQGEAYFRYGNGDTFEGKFFNNSFSKGKYTIGEDGSYFIGNFSGGQPSNGQWYDSNGNKINE